MTRTITNTSEAEVMPAVRGYRSQPPAEDQTSDQPTMSDAERPDWARYLEEFHERRAGVVGAVLARCRATDLTVYHWLLRPVAMDARRILDLACGSGMVARHLATDAPRVAAGRSPTVVGVDCSAAELKLAHDAGEPVARADATTLPFSADSFDAVVSSMGLAVASPLGTVLAECARVVRPGGVLVAVIPSAMPLRASDLSILTPLTARLRSTPQFPTRHELSDLTATCAGAGFDVLEDARERFVCNVRNLDDAELLISALYLPDACENRRAGAARWLADRAARFADGVDVAIPIRRVVAMRADDG